MSLFSLPRRYGNLRRATEIALTLARHGFGHLLHRMGMAEHLPGVSRLKLRVTEAEEGIGPAPQRLARVLEELGPTFIKFGQLLATRPDILPPEYVRAFSRLQDRVDPFPAGEAKEIIESALGRSVEEIFSTFDPDPVASGSLGQVHRAVLRDGTAVIVKVKRPHADARIRDDLDILLWLAEQVEKHLEELQLLRPRELCEEFSRTIRRELDFVAEAAYTSRFAREFAKNPDVAIPGIQWDLVSRDVLVMERIGGTRIVEVTPETFSESECRAVAEKLGRTFMHQFFMTGIFQADPHPGNLFVTEEGRIGLIDFGQVGHLSSELRQQLAAMLVAISHGDFDTVADLYADIGGVSDETDIGAFKNELSSIIDRYYGVPVEKIDFGRAFEEAIAVAREHRVHLPRNLVMLGKSMVTIVGVAQRLDPEFRIDQVARPFAKKIVGHRLNPLDMVKSSAFGAFRLGSVLRRMPRDLRDVIHKMRRGNFRVIFHHEALDDLTQSIDRAFSRLSLALVLAAIIIGSALVLSSPGLGKLPLPLVGETPLAYVFGVVGFGAAVILAFALVVSIFRSGRL
jgi:ubiquinone biosynthesis protein